MSENQLKKRAFGVGRALVLLPFTALAVVGCAQVIGLGDYTVASDNGGGSGGTVGAGATGGKTGTSGAGGKTGSAGSAGRTSGGEGGTSAAGTTGTSGGSAGVGGSTTGTAGSSTGTAGTGGSAPVTGAVGCDGKTAITVNEQVVQSCILRAGCDPFDPVRTISTCVTNNTQDAFAGERCNLKAKTCADYQACEHNGIAGDDLCPQAKWGTEFCVGNQAVSCTQDGEFSSFVDCTGEGAMGCGTYMDSGSQVADCTLSNESCVGVSSDYVCSDETTPLYEYYCVANQAYGLKCGDFSYCDDSSGTAGCFLTAATCGADSTTCSNNIAKVCASGGEYDYDCGSVGLACNNTGASTADSDTSYCLAPGCKLTDLTNCTESCDGTKLNFCYGGAQVTVDCVTYGFNTCDTFTTNGTPGFSYAACVNE